MDRSRAMKMAAAACNGDDVQDIRGVHCAYNAGYTHMEIEAPRPWCAGSNDPDVCEQGFYKARVDSAVRVRRPVELDPRLRDLGPMSDGPG